MPRIAQRSRRTTTRPLRSRVPDQGEPAAPGRRGGHRYEAANSASNRGGLQAELLAVMAMTENRPTVSSSATDSQDDSYIEAVTLATKLGRTIIPVGGKLRRVGLILKHAQANQVRPRLGVRVKLFSEGSGRWRPGGEKSSCLFITEILELFNVLKARDMLDCLQLGALPPRQPAAGYPPRERRHQRARTRVCGAEADGCRAAIHRRGRRSRCRLRRSGTNFSSSMNYTLNEYASDVVYRIASVCNARDIPHPMIVSEIRPRRRRVSQRPIFMPRLVRARPIPSHRPGKRRTTAATRNCPHQCRTCS